MRQLHSNKLAKQVLSNTMMMLRANQMKFCSFPPRTSFYVLLHNAKNYLVVRDSSNGAHTISINGDFYRLKETMEWLNK